VPVSAAAEELDELDEVEVDERVVVLLDGEVEVDVGGVGVDGVELVRADAVVVAGGRPREPLERGVGGDVVDAVAAAVAGSGTAAAGRLVDARLLVLGAVARVLDPVDAATPALPVSRFASRVMPRATRPTSTTARAAPSSRRRRRGPPATPAARLIGVGAPGGSGR
jgi:hypothetical protein